LQGVGNQRVSIANTGVQGSPVGTASSAPRPVLLGRWFLGGLGGLSGGWLGFQNSGSALIQSSKRTHSRVEDEQIRLAGIHRGCGELASFFMPSSPMAAENFIQFPKPLSISAAVFIGLKRM